MFHLTDLSNLNLKDQIADSSSLKTTTIPKDTLFYEDTYFEPSLILGKLLCSKSNIYLKILILHPTTLKMIFFF